MAKMGHPVQFTEYESVTQKRGFLEHEVPDLATLAASLEHVESPEKQELFNAALLEDPHAGRTDQNIRAMGRIFVADIDGATDAQVERLLEGLVGTSCLLYTSHSHGLKDPEKNRLRVVVELDRPYSREEFYGIFDAANKRLGGCVDGNTRKPSQPYYLPTHPPGAQFMLEYQPGEPWRVDELLAEAPAPKEPSTTRPPAPMQVSRLDVEELAHRLVRRGPKSRKQGTQLRAVLEGAAFADGGDRDNSIYRLACTLVEAFPDLDPAPLSALFAPSLMAMGGDLTPADVQAKLERRQGEEQARRQAAAEKRRTEREERIRHSYGGERDWVATEEEMAALRYKYGEMRLRRLYVVSKDRFHFILRPTGEYMGPFSSEDLTVAAHRDLAVFSRIETEYETQNREWRRKTPQMLREDYGDVMGEVVYDMTAETTHYEPNSKTLRVATCPPAVKPAFHEEIQEWLQLLGGDLAVDVAASMLRLDRMTAAPVFIGQKGGGKTLFAVLPARALGGPPADISELSSQFNELLARMPVVLADESMGDDYRRRGSTFVRSHLGKTTRYVEPKYKPKGKLYGALRLVIVANNMHVLETTEDLSQEDMAALSERLIYMHVDHKPVAYLERIGAERIQKHWINAGAGGEHFLWLAKNWEIKNPGTRFLVQGEQSELHDSMVSGMGLAGEVVDWLLNYLSDPAVMDTQRHLGVRVAEGNLLATSRTLHERWDTYAKTRVSSQARIGRALSSISHGTRKQLKDGAGKPTNYYVIRKEVLRSALSRHQLAEWVFEETLHSDTPENIVELKQKYPDFKKGENDGAVPF